MDTKSIGAVLSGIVDVVVAVLIIVLKLNGLLDLNWIWTIVIMVVLIFASSLFSLSPTIAFIILKIIGKLYISWWWIIVAILLFLFQFVGESLVDNGDKIDGIGKK